MLPAKSSAPIRWTELQESNFNRQINGQQTALYTIRNNCGMVVKATNYGAKVQQILVPTTGGWVTDVALGYENIEDVISGHASMGAFIGRYANRIGNAQFILDGKTHMLTRNNGVNSLHGGVNGSRFRVFSAHQPSPNTLELRYVFKDGEEGFPGTLPLFLTYSLNDRNEFRIEWSARAIDKTTVANFTSHIFFNLCGDPSASMEDCVIEINADRYLPIDKLLVPTGEIANVAGTPMDFRSARTLRSGLDTEFQQTGFGNGYDHHYVLNKPLQALPLSLSFAASVKDPTSGRRLEVWTTEPGLQFFSGNNLSGNSKMDIGKGKTAFQYRSAVCLEPSRYPDSPNVSHFPSTTLRPGDTYEGAIVYKFFG